MKTRREMSKCREFDAPILRVETGSTQFGDDWPGVFIRGDMLSVLPRPSVGCSRVSNLTRRSSWRMRSV